MYVISLKIKINILQDAGILKKFFPASRTLLVGSGVADVRWQNWNTTEAVQPSTPRLPSSKKHR